MEQIREETDHRLKLRLLSAALMIFVAQLDINLIINGFRISLAIIFLPVFAFLSKGFPVFSSIKVCINTTTKLNIGINCVAGRQISDISMITIFCCIC